MKEFIRFVLQIIIGCTLCIGILHLYGQGKDLVVPPKPGPVQVPRVIPPAPRIVSPVFKAKQTGLFEEFMQYISTPCTPILPAFKLAHNPEAVRPWVAKVIQEQHFGRFNLGQVCDVFDHLLLRWKPLDDPTHNELVTAAAALWEMPAGDCDDFSVALSAALTSIGGVTRISFVYNAENQGHAYPEICLGRIDRTKAFDIRLPFEAQTCRLGDADRGNVLGIDESDHAFEAEGAEGMSDDAARRFAGKPATPKGGVQQIGDLDLKCAVDLPGQQAAATDKQIACPVDRRPEAEFGVFGMPAQEPLQLIFRLVRRQHALGKIAPHHGIAVERR